jgi:hypothetical protein
MEKYVLPLLQGRLLATERNTELYSQKYKEANNINLIKSATYYEEKLREVQAQRDELEAAIKLLSHVKEVRLLGGGTSIYRDFNDM